MTISPHMISAFTEEIAKLSSFDEAAVSHYDELRKLAAPPVAKMSGKAKALLGAVGVGGVGLGMAGEQAKDDIVSGRTMRRGQARAQGIRPMWT